uniref:ABC transporter domain-containing protein n=1 Tax=Globisporangium ultimum (strain ATCC 200006 / CBS 805.95 / DAOM BR144) TaxID=431595 RepID=K3WZK7_GLOUD
MADKKIADSKQVSLESGKTLMAHGPHVLHEYVSTKLETALGRALPQMEVRFSNLSLSADITLADEGSSKAELPTLLNTIKKSFVSSKSHQVRKEILKNVSGSFKPGTITLLLGQPSSGKSSLMKILSGRFPVEKNITVEGDITYNGVPQKEITKTLPQFAAYVNQRDKHYPVLTVKETLEFAHTFTGGELTRRGEELLSKGSPEENLAALEAAKAMFAHYPDVIIQQLGLQNCQNTIVGDAMLRGVSGGERKRVTTGEMEFGMKYMTLMDEISTGLDSAATYDIVNTQRSIAKTLRKTVVIALLQPSPEVFSLFDDIMIMNEGEVIYHGPREQVVDYFESLGFKCPPERDVADYLLDLGTSQQQKYEVRNPDKQHKHPRYASEFAEIFRSSAIYANTLHELDAPHNPELLANVAAHMEPMPEFHQSFWASTMTLFRRQLLVQFRNTPFIVGRVMMIVIMGLLYSSTFYQFDPTEIQVVMGIIFAAVLFLSLGQASQIPTFITARDIFYKQRRANFFRTSSYVLANSVAQIPMAIGETILFGTLVYWMCGFSTQAVEFIVFEVILLLTNLAFGAWFFFLAAVCADNNIATPLSMVSILIYIIFAGFIVTKSQIPDYFIWLYWISPVSWSLRALAVNQYRSSTFDVCVYRGVNYCEQFNNQKMGQYYLNLFDVPSEKTWVPYAIIVMIVLYVIFMFLSFLALEYKRYEAPENVSVTKKDAAEDGYFFAETPKNTETVSRADSDSVILEVNANETGIAPVTLAFKDLQYSVPLPSNPKESIYLLKGITGYALPGTMTALMGSSGAGKTTLMDVIAGRKTGGKIQGQILLNGYEANDLAIRRSTGYCEQMDIHSEASTIREALTFSAFLRQDSSVPDSKKFDSVNECLDLLDMHNIADQIIRGSSVEQMKRLTIGVELAAQPSVLFLDEPTSGLDARSAKLIMDGVRKVANTGRTIVCTIHQPSSEVFFLFDSLLLLKRGGETVFFGDLGKNCRNLINYFEAIPGVAPITPGYNPATWMLECIGAGVGSASTDAPDFVHVFNHSENKRKLDETMAKPGVCTPAPGAQELIFTQKRAANSAVQMKYVVGRFMDLYWRTPSYNLTRFMLSIILSLLFGTIFVDAEYASYQGINSGCIGAGVGSASTDAPDFVHVFNHSENKRKLDETMAKPGVCTPAPGAQELIFTQKRAANSAVQMKYVVGRFMDLYWRTPSYNLTRFMLSIILSLLFGTIFVDAEYASYQGINSGVGMLFVALLFSGMVSFNSVLPIASEERASFYRERASQTYNAFWYFVGSTLAEVPYVFFSGLLFTVIFYPMVGFTGFGTAVLFWLNLSLLILLQTYMGQFLAYALPSEEVAAIIGVLVNSVFFLFMGFSPPANAIPSGYQWLYKITPQRFPLSIAVSLVFADCDELPTWNETLGQYENIGSKLGCQPLANAPVSIGPTTVKQFTEDVFGMKHDDIVPYFFIVIGYIVGFRILAALALRYINHQKR